MINQQYFGHDAYKRAEPAVKNMLRRWGMKGYGMYWVIIELLRESNEYRLPFSNREHFRFLADELHSTTQETKHFVTDLKRFELLQGDDRYIWSDDLLARMEILEEKRQKARISANTRWHKDKPPAAPDHANAMRTHSDGSAMAMQVKESKVKEIKEEKSTVEQSKVKDTIRKESILQKSTEQERDAVSPWEAPRPDNAIFWWQKNQSITDGEAKTLLTSMPDLSDLGLRNLLTRLLDIYLDKGRNAGPFTKFVMDHINSLDQGQYSELIAACEPSGK